MDSLTPYSGLKVLVTGARGFIGRHLCHALVRQGSQVYALHRTAPELGCEMPQTRSLYADLSDLEALSAALQGVHPQVVFHLAASTNRELGPAAIRETFACNAVGTHNLLQVLAERAPEIVVISGTADVYGHDFPPLREDLQGRPETPYGSSKASAWTWAQASSVACVEARLFMVYGPHQSANFFLSQLMNATVTGKPLAMTAGEQTRDFTWIEDVVQGLLFLGRRPDLAREAFNLCSGRETSLRQVIQLLGNIVGQPIPVELGALPYRPREVFRLFGDPSKLAAQGFRCETTLEVGLARWYKALKESL